MIEVKRYQADWLGMFLDLPGRRMGTEERLVVLASDFDRVTAERDGLQMSLNTADQSIDELNAAISRRTHRVRELEALLTAADERADVLEGLLREWLIDFGRTHSGLQRLKERTQAALKPAEGRNPPTCTWSHDGIGIWAGSCGTKWAFTDDGPTENGMRFCHSCGKALVVADEGEGDDA